MFRIKDRWRRGPAVIARVIFGAIFCFPFVLVARFDGLLVANTGVLMIMHFFANGTRYLDTSNCLHDPFFDEVTRCNARSYSFGQSYLFASAMKGQPTFDRSKLRQSRPEKLRSCRKPASHWRVSCKRIGVPADYSCYFCAFKDRKHDVDYSLLALHDTRPVAIRIITGNIDIRKPENHSAKLGNYFDLKILFAE